MRPVLALMLVALAMSAIGSVAATADPLPFPPSPAPPLPTEIQPPVAGTMTTSPADHVLSTIAHVSGIVRAYDRPVTFEFDYGTTSAYGQHTEPISLPAATETGTQGMGGELLDLTPQTTYHYRISVTSNLGTFGGEDQSFTTTAEGPVRGTMGGSVLISGHRASLLVGCTGESNNSCVGTVRLSTTSGNVRSTLGTGSFSFSTGPITSDSPTALLVHRGELVPITLTHQGQSLLSGKLGMKVAATVTVERGSSVSQSVLVRSDSSAVDEGARASFPTKSYLATLRHAKGGKGPHQKPISEDYAASQVKRFETKARGQERRGFPQLADLYRDKKATFAGELHYLRALDQKITAQDPERFDYPRVLRWLDRLHHRLLTQGSRLAKGLHKGDFTKFKYVSGGETALGVNRPKIVAIGRARGVNIS